MGFSIRSIMGRNRPASQPTGASLPRVAPTGNPTRDLQDARRIIDSAGLSPEDHKRGVNPAGGGLRVSDRDRQAGFIHPDQRPKQGMIKPSDLDWKQDFENRRAMKENRPPRPLKRIVDGGRPPEAFNYYTGNQF